MLDSWFCTSGCVVMVKLEVNNFSNEKVTERKMS